MITFLENKLFLSFILIMSAFLAIFTIVKFDSLSVLLMVAVFFIFLLALIKPNFIIYLLIFFIIVGELVRIPLPGSNGTMFVLIVDLVLPILVLAWFVSILKNKKINFPKFISLHLVLFLIILFSTFLLNVIFHTPKESLDALLYLVRFVIYLFLPLFVFQLLNIYKDIQRIVYFLLFSGLIVAIGGVIQLILVPNFSFMTQFGWDPHSGRALSTFFDPNFFGGFLVINISIILGFYFFTRRFSYKFSLACLALFEILVLLLTYSRSSYLAFAAMAIIIILFESRKIFISLIIISVIVLIFFPRAVSRLEGIRNLDSTAQARITSWNKALTIIKDHPLTGVGYNFLPSVKLSYGFIGDPAAHTAGGFDSSLLTLWATTGIFGLFSFIIFYGALIYQQVRTLYNKNFSNFNRGLSLGLLACLVALLVHSQFVNSLLYPFIVIFLFIFIGVQLKLYDLEIKKSTSL